MGILTSSVNKAHCTIRFTSSVKENFPSFVCVILHLFALKMSQHRDIMQIEGNEIAQLSICYWQALQYMAIGQ